MMQAVETTTLPLRDIHLPEAISWWPPAPGWWLLLGLFIAIVMTLTWWWRRRQAARVRVAAVEEWRQLMTRYQQDGDTVRLVQGLSILLRRVSLSYHPREEVAGLSGDAWLHYLDNYNPLSPKSGFVKGPGRLLLDAPYRQQFNGDVEALYKLCGEWLAALPPLKVG